MRAVVLCMLAMGAAALSGCSSGELQAALPPVEAPDEVQPGFVHEAREVGGTSVGTPFVTFRTGAAMRAEWTMPKNATFVQAELEWSAAAPPGEATLSCRQGGRDHEASGTSPLALPWWPEPGPVRVVCDVWAQASGMPANAFVEQAFTIHVTAFYGMEPAEGWSWVADGAPAVPDA